MLQSLLPFTGGIPVLILIGVIYFEIWRRKYRKERSPLSEKLLRPAGYYLQCKVEALSISLDSWMLGAVAFSILAVCGIPFAPLNSRIIFLIILGLFSAICTIMAVRRTFEIRRCRRGLLGEQAVAEELQRLLSLGYQVFHDVPSDGKWNIDHVAVGRAGVFAVETKYRRKKPGKNGKRDQDATFDGNQIKFASGEYDARATGQARENARWLANFLSKATGERVTAQPIVALPGWFVTLTANSDVKVISGKNIFNHISSEPDRLSDKVIKQISYQLDLRCRDVEI
jgi:hypothetical protein